MLGEEKLSKLDKQKEILTTLRVFFTVLMAVVVAIGSGLSSLVNSNTLNETFYIGVSLEILLICLITFVLIRLKKETDKIERM